MELEVYTGTQTTDRTNLFRLTSFAVSDNVTFEIGEIVRDYILQTFDGDYASANVWVDYRTKNYIQGVAGSFTSYTQLTGFDGYGYYEDEANPQNDSGLLQSNTKVVKLDDAPATIPVDTSKTTQVTYELNGQQVYTKAVTSSVESDEQIEYVTNGVNGADEYENRVIQDGGTFENSVCLQEFVDDFTLFDFDTIYIDTTDGVIKLTVDNIEECKYLSLKPI